ncbi:winged helix-turn-helix transcriptional regulator [Candidatus Bathyarchaeota archaeon]|nr:winged helix-turn-helix transcriptional regulator [Candidatus Bathyarchaeota archaeon]
MLNQAKAWKNTNFIPKDRSQAQDSVSEIVFETIRKLESLGFIITPISIPGPDIDAKILYVIWQNEGKLTSKDLAERLGFKSKRPVIERLKRLAKNELIVYKWACSLQNPRWNLGRNQRLTLTKEGRLIANNTDKLGGNWLNLLEKIGFNELRKKYGF